MAILALAINHALLLLRERALLHAFFHGRVLLMLFRSGKLSIQCMFHVCRNHAPTWRHISILCLPKSVERKGNKHDGPVESNHTRAAASGDQEFFLVIFVKVFVWYGMAPPRVACAGSRAIARSPRAQRLLVEGLGVGGGGRNVSVTGSLVGAGGELELVGRLQVGIAGGAVGGGVVLEVEEKGEHG